MRSCGAAIRVKPNARLCERWVTRKIVSELRSSDWRTFATNRLIELSALSFPIIYRSISRLMGALRSIHVIHKSALSPGVRHQGPPALDYQRTATAAA